MIDINEIRTVSYNIAAKQLSGFPTVEEWNKYANLANMDLFNYWNDIRRKELLKVKTGIVIKVPNALNPFLTVESSINISSGVLPLPNTVSDVLTVSVGLNKKNVPIVDYDRWNNTLNSSIDAPSVDAPIVMQVPTGLKVEPSTGVSALNVTYLSYPEDVKWAYTLTGNRPVYNAGGSVNFKWNPSEKIKLLMNILKYMGISIREPELVQYAIQQEAVSN